jgi:excisionase family DNA binding protein
VAKERQHSQTKPVEPDAPDHSKDKRGEYLTARQLAEVLQISEATVHRLRRNGRIPAVLLTDRLIRFNLREVQKALRPRTSLAESNEPEHEQEPTPQLSFEDLDSSFVTQDV